MPSTIINDVRRVITGAVVVADSPSVFLGADGDIGRPKATSTCPPTVFVRTSICSSDGVIGAKAVLGRWNIWNGIVGNLRKPTLDLGTISWRNHVLRRPYRRVERDWGEYLEFFRV